MHIDGYISEFLEFEPIEITSVDDLFLRYVLFGTKTSYRIFSSLKKIKHYEGDVSKVAASLAYKNVNKRMHKLHDAGLLEEIKIAGGYTHGARNYRVTSRGLVYLFSNGIAYFNNVLEKDRSSPYTLEEYYDSTLFKTFIIPYFEKSTLLHISRTLAVYLEHYMQEICKNIRFYLGHEHVGFYFGDEDMDSGPDSDIRDEDMDSDESFPKAFPPMQELNISLNWCIRSFFLKITIMKAEFIDWDWWQYHQWHGKHDTKMKEKMETFYLLTKDHKFMKAWRKAGKDFLEGYSQLMDFYQYDRHNPFIYRIKDTDEWACKNCVITGDIWFMRGHKCA